MKILAVLAFALLVGCAGNEKHDSDQMALLKMHYENQKPIFKLEGIEGQTIQISGVKSLEVNFPQNAPILPAPQPHPIWQTLNNMLPFVATIGVMREAGKMTIGVANAVGASSRVPQANISSVSTNTSTSSTVGATTKTVTSTTGSYNPATTTTTNTTGSYNPATTTTTSTL